MTKFVYENSGEPVSNSVYLALCTRAWAVKQPEERKGSAWKHFTLRLDGEGIARSVSQLDEACSIDMYADHATNRIWGFAFDECNTEEHLPAVRVVEEEEKGMEKRIVNCTPHAVNIVDADGNPVRTIEPNGNPIRLKAKTVSAGECDGVPLSKTVFGEAQNLPEPEEGTLFIVSQLVKNSCPDRADFVVPAEVVRDEGGNILGCRSLGL